uniref:Oxidoreductase-like domain-containing protein n=1 Tax=Palpitomonas bilix TaxID=652834 RepID=A0A7S3DEF7_9EUKA|mmetsp:Transcript_33588/g.86003  ORF Transcript_33588/g.86003 Transcript_33588/m.86003 type:complete len:152 (+) Transcript_33588:272-727(+)
MAWMPRALCGKLGMPCTPYLLSARGLRTAMRRSPAFLHTYAVAVHARSMYSSQSSGGSVALQASTSKGGNEDIGEGSTARSGTSEKHPLSLDGGWGESEGSEEEITEQPPFPTNCCGNGCPNCVMFEYMEKMEKYEKYRKKLEAIKKKESK